MIDLIERRLDVKLNNPVILPATFSRHGNRLFRRFSRPVSIGIFMEDRIEDRFDHEFDNSLSDSVRHGGHASFLVPPFALGISTCLTGGGKYDPNDIRFHSLYRFPERFCSNMATVSSSTPAAPRLALTSWYASHTTRFAMQ